MGKYLKGILGPFSGLVGAVVGATWNGIEVLRSRPNKSKRPATEAQMKQRDKFALITEFSSPVNDLIRIGFQAYHTEQTPYNAALRLNIDNAVMGVYPVLTIDYSKFVISKGKLTDTPQISMATTEDAQLDFSWLNNAEPGTTNGTDKITFLVYNPAKQRFVKAPGAAIRSALSYDMVLPASWSGDNVHVWAFCVRADGKLTSDSIYVGATVVQ